MTDRIPDEDRDRYQRRMKWLSDRRKYLKDLIGKENDRTVARYMELFSFPSKAELGEEAWEHEMDDIWQTLNGDQKSMVLTLCQHFWVETAIIRGIEGEID